MKWSDNIFNKLFIFEMANNHMGSVEHGINIIKEIGNSCKDFDFNFGFKLQYRHLDSFIHPDFKGHKDVRHIRRFEETRLDENQFKKLKDAITDMGFISICTPFDEKSVDLIEKHGFDIVKIGSCSFTDWPLLERIADTDKPVIVSTAGASNVEIDRVVSFFEHREKKFALMHCVGDYPTTDENLHLNRIDYLKARYPQISIGYSTHENTDNFDAIKIAIAKGAGIFEKHVGLKTEEFGLNNYSASPGQVYEWLKSGLEAFKMCGSAGKKLTTSEAEKSSLVSLRRGVFAKQPISKGEKIEPGDIFFAMPNINNQVTANDMSKYKEYYAAENIDINKPLLSSNTSQTDNREDIYKIVQQVKGVIKKSKVFVPARLDFEISHHYGVSRFNEYGITMINFVNREYCKKLIILIPGQKHPEQYHKIKEETFHILYGEITLNLDGIEKKCRAGDIITIEREVKHNFCTGKGAVIEEISSTHIKDDSYYVDENITNSKNRKTFITYWLD